MMTLSFDLQAKLTALLIIYNNVFHLPHLSAKKKEQGILPPSLRNTNLFDLPAISKSANECALSTRRDHASSFFDPIYISDCDQDPVCDWWIQSLSLYQMTNLHCYLRES